MSLNLRSHPCRNLLLIAATFVLALQSTAVRAADSLAGAWIMVKYEGPATSGKTTGQLLFTDKHFSLIYAMDSGDQRWSRAHAGTYELKDGTITYHIDFNVQYVDNKGAVSKKPFSRTATYVLSGNSLTVTFDNGSVQGFERAK